LAWSSIESLVKAGSLKRERRSSVYLKEKSSGHLVEVLSLNDLFNPYHEALVGRYHYGEELQDPEKFPKGSLVFPSGEALPRCWLDSHYRDAEVYKNR
jgi:hypothetical protein